MSGKLTEMVDEMTPDGVIYGQFAHARQIVNAALSFAVTCSDLP